MDSTISALMERANALEHSSPYGYVPSKAPGFAYIVIFALGTLLHLALGIRYKYWIAFVTLIPGGILEIVGWGGRLWSSYLVLNSNPFIMQICCLILGPAFFSAWAYTILGYCITRLGSAYSLLKPKWYLIIFVTADIISLILQAIGGGKAAVAAKAGTDTKQSTKIMLAGILFQLGTMTIFSILAIDFIVRVTTHRPYKRPSASPRSPAESDKPQDDLLPGFTNDGNTTPELMHAHADEDPTTIRRVKWLLFGVAFASAMIYVRGVYRSIELAQGWTGYLITHEDYFTYLDGLPMVLCLFAFGILHPGWLLPRRQGWARA